MSIKKLAKQFINEPLHIQILRLSIVVVAIITLVELLKKIGGM